MKHVTDVQRVRMQNGSFWTGAKWGIRLALLMVVAIIVWKSSSEPTVYLDF